MNVVSEPNNVHTYEWCRLCGCGWDAADVIADILDDKGRCIGHVCPSCIAAGPQDARRRMISHAQRLEEEAADLRTIAAESEWEAFPTHEAAPTMSPRRFALVTPCPAHPARTLADCPCAGTLRRQMRATGHVPTDDELAAHAELAAIEPDHDAPGPF
jgi:hypothetical protein